MRIDVAHPGVASATIKLPLPQSALGVWDIEFLEIVGVHETDRSLDADRSTRRQRG